MTTTFNAIVIVETKGNEEISMRTVAELIAKGPCRISMEQFALLQNINEEGKQVLKITEL